jgi:hypothetical protein
MPARDHHGHLGLERRKISGRTIGLANTQPTFERFLTTLILPHHRHRCGLMLLLPPLGIDQVGGRELKSTSSRRHAKIVKGFFDELVPE